MLIKTAMWGIVLISIKIGTLEGNSAFSIQQRIGIEIQPSDSAPGNRFAMCT